MQSPSSVLRRNAASNIGVLIAALLTWPAVSTAQPTLAQPPQAATGQPIAAERQNWRKEMLAVPRPTNGCYTATYPERQWREVPCKTPPNKPYFPRAGETTRLETVGDVARDFSAVVTGHITEAEGSFDNVTGVMTNPAYSLQLNTDFFPTTTCGGSPNRGCRGWVQFIYESNGTGFIQYWLINYGPAGTVCPIPRSANCDGTGVFNDGWCPFTIGTSANPLYCAINALNGLAPTAEPATNLGQIRVKGAWSAGVNGAGNDAIIVTVGPDLFVGVGDNHFPDLGNQWKEAEFNVFGNCCNTQAVFNTGSSATVRIEVTSGTNIGPGCDLRSFTGESNNLTLQNVPVASSGALPALVFAESNPAVPGGTADCNDTIFDIAPIIAEILAPADIVTIMNDHF